MPTQQLLLHLPDELVRRLKRAVPARSRSKFIQNLLEQALPPDGVGRPGVASGTHLQLLDAGLFNAEAERHRTHLPSA